MQKRLSRFGVGPRIVASALAYGALAFAVTRASPGVCLFAPELQRLLIIPAVILVIIGIPMWLWAIFSVMRAYERDCLVTSGVFALCRHPVYAAWIVFLLPGLALLTRSWPLLLTPLVAYLVFRWQIHYEDDYLARRFGNAYSEYRKKVNEVIPFPRF